MKRIYSLVLSLVLIVMLCACSVTISDEGTSGQSNQSGTESDQSNTYAGDGGDATDTTAEIDEDGTYDSRDEVALYIHTYDRLPSNYITKKEARALGWDGGSVERYAPGKCIGGDRFGNYEEKLPDDGRRSYRECDIDTLGKSSRGAKRIIFSDDGLIYYTEDHYDTFELVYGDEGE